MQTPAVKPNFKPQPLDQLLLHNSDIIVKPIISSYENLSVNIESNITKWTSENISENVNSAKLENDLSEVYSILISNSSISLKISHLMYLESLVLDFPIANKLINSAFVQVFLKLFVLDSIEMKARVCSIFGQLLRYATIIDSDLPKSLLVDNLLEIITQNSSSDEVTVKRKAIAALGEYLFYAATQMDEEEYDDAWNIDEKLVQILNQEICQSEDEVCRLYATRTIENITAQSNNGGIIFATNVNFT